MHATPLRALRRASREPEIMNIRVYPTMGEPRANRTLENALEPGMPALHQLPATMLHGRSGTRKQTDLGVQCVGHAPSTVCAFDASSDLWQHGHP